MLKLYSSKSNIDGKKFYIKKHKEILFNETIQIKLQQVVILNLLK